MAESGWKINVKGVTGTPISVQVPNPGDATILDLKQLIHRKQSDLPPFLQRLVYRTAGRASTKLEDFQKLSAYPEVTDGCTLFLVRLLKCELYIHDARGNLHSIVVPSSEPENYSIAELVCLFEDKVGQRMDEYQFQFKGKPVEETCHGRQLTLKTYGIKTGDTLFVMKLGFTLDITNPEVDLCFFVDCTGSMSGSIEAVKNNIKQLRDGLDAEYKGCDLRFAFVRYTDYDQPAHTRTTWIDFTKSQSAFHSFVSAIRADGGGDGPEDVMGGLKAVFTNISWRTDATKVLIHIADAPCHGTQYHDGGGDNHPYGDPAGISHEQMMGEVAKREVQYWFGYINKSSTDKMIGVFNESLRRQSSNHLMIRQFEALQQDEVREGVHKAVTSSVYASKAAKKASVRSYTLDPSAPNWSSVPEQRARKTPPPGQLTLHHLQEGIKLEEPVVHTSLKCALRPFAEGEESIVFRGYDLTNRRDVVLKQSRRDASEYNSLEHYMMVLQIHTVAAAYAREFNSEKLKPQATNSIEFVPLDVIQCTNGTCYSMEPFVLGKFEKYNNNVGVVDSKSPLSPLLQAFSHYTWEKSGRSLLVCDLQGVQNGSKVQLVDPAIHSRNPGSKFGVTDLGLTGVQRFFKTHSCNDVCHAMALSTPSIKLQTA